MANIMCIPNFSEGNNQVVIDAIADAIRKTSGVTLFSVEPGSSTNRTVYTFFGTAADVVTGALNAALKAHELIDMTKHKGEHPRLGAMDVCPFVPLGTATMAECVECANDLSKKLERALGVPVYLYGFAQEKLYRRSVPQIREGEYEGLKERFQTVGEGDSKLVPDYGKSEFVPSWGASMVGARSFLIAYNVNLLGTKEQANRIAFNIREKGRSPNEPGRLKSVQAIGWYLTELALAQISINLTDLSVTPLHVAFEECLKDAKDLGLSVAGSEIVGLVPLQAILEAAEFYIQRDNLFILDQDMKIRLVVDRLGLSSLSYFDPSDKVIELAVKKARGSPNSLMTSTVKDFVEQVRSRSPAPGGGSVSALIAALGAGLTSMFGLLTFGTRKFERLDRDMRRLLPRTYHMCDELLLLVDEDAESYTGYMNACKLPKSSDEEKLVRDNAMEKALLAAISLPLGLAQKVNALWKDVGELAEIGNINCLSDAQVGVRCLETAVWGAYYNVKINLKELHNEEKRQEIKEKIEQELSIAKTYAAQILERLDARTD